jgi:sugar phosphate isomerase/epimerase
MKFAINENTIFQCGLFDFIQACAGSGCKAVELSYGKVMEALKFVPAGEIRAMIEASGLRVLSLNAFEDALLYPHENLAILRTEAELIAKVAESVACPAIVIPSSRWNPSLGSLPPRGRITEQYQECLSLIAEVFGEYSVEPLFEPIAYDKFIVGTPDWTNEILADPRLTTMRIVPDVHNLHVNGAGPGQLGNFKNAIGIIHIDDTQDPKQFSSHVAKTRAFPGEGIASATSWVEEAGKIGYDGYYSLELFSDSIYALNCEEAAKLCMNKLLAFERLIVSN